MEIDWNYLSIYQPAECCRESNEQKKFKTGTTVHDNFTTTSKKRPAGQFSGTTSVVLDVVLAWKKNPPLEHTCTQKVKNPESALCWECQVTEFVQLRDLPLLFLASRSLRSVASLFGSHTQLSVRCNARGLICRSDLDWQLLRYQILRCQLISKSKTLLSSTIDRFYPDQTCTYSA